MISEALAPLKTAEEWKEASRATPLNERAIDEDWIVQKRQILPSETAGANLAPSEEIWSRQIHQIRKDFDLLSKRRECSRRIRCLQRTGSF